MIINTPVTLKAILLWKSKSSADKSVSCTQKYARKKRKLPENREEESEGLVNKLLNIKNRANCRKVKVI